MNDPIEFAHHTLKPILRQYIPITTKAEQLLWAYLNQSYGIYVEAVDPDLTIFVNAQNTRFRKEFNNLAGDIQLSPIIIRQKNQAGISENPYPMASARLT
ncbi:hypothetical protein QQ056_11385 [Oscillatoria laete-virens NRMC-F 0139]|nr:hypothetical protein [Oscillatoria laete-virens]MDL5054144.1 hypothetical protein [Oscillatoria laete-virens NRMC-F 0139]